VEHDGQNSLKTINFSRTFVNLGLAKAEAAEK
jgi:hypothetical protein